MQYCGSLIVWTELEDALAQRLSFVTYKPLFHQMIVALYDKSSIVEEIVHDLAIAPSSIFVKQSQRGVPMEQHRGDLKLLPSELGHHIVIVLDSLFVDQAFAEREDARP